MRHSLLHADVVQHLRKRGGERIKGQRVQRYNVQRGQRAQGGRSHRHALELASEQGRFADGGARPDLDASNFAADLNPASLEVLTGSLVEPALAATAPGAAVQFERQGYFCLDADSKPDKLVFNRTVGLRDTWAKVQTGAKQPA